MKLESIFGWASLASFILLVIDPIQAFAGLFMILLGLYFICYGIAVYLAERLEDMGFGATYYGKAARFVGVCIFCFGLIIFVFGVSGLGLLLKETLVQSLLKGL